MAATHTPLGTQARACDDGCAASARSCGCGLCAGGSSSPSENVSPFSTPWLPGSCLAPPAGATDAAFLARLRAGVVPLCSSAALCRRPISRRTSAGHLAPPCAASQARISTVCCEGGRPRFLVACCAVVSLPCGCGVRFGALCCCGLGCVACWLAAAPPLLAGDPPAAVAPALRAETPAAPGSASTLASACCKSCCVGALLPFCAAADTLSLCRNMSRAEAGSCSWVLGGSVATSCCSSARGCKGDEPSTLLAPQPSTPGPSCFAAGEASPLGCSSGSSSYWR